MHYESYIWSFILNADAIPTADESETIDESSAMYSIYKRLWAILYFNETILNSYKHVTLQWDNQYNNMYVRKKINILA